MRRLTKEERETAKKNNIPYHTWYGRINHHGWSIEEAITIPPHGKKTQKELATEHGISYHTLHSRIYKNGWSLEEALNTPVNSKE